MPPLEGSSHAVAAVKIVVVVVHCRRRVAIEKEREKRTQASAQKEELPPFVPLVAVALSSSPLFG
ncbi:uncharacterized protein DS421_3g75230 [Arachis hypogaea]|nr:uncharacterized protein DS421_3g75230 [Arachis hypogaea]